MLEWALPVRIDFPPSKEFSPFHFLWPLSSFGSSGLRGETIGSWPPIAPHDCFCIPDSWMSIAARRKRPLQGLPEIMDKN